MLETERYKFSLFLKGETMNKIILVEGKTDKRALIQAGFSKEDIICTYGTVSFEQLEELIDQLEQEELYFLFDEDFSGDKLRKQFIQAFPNGTIIRIPKEYKQVAETPVDVLISILDKHFLL